MYTHYMNVDLLRQAANALEEAEIVASGQKELDGQHGPRKRA